MRDSRSDFFRKISVADSPATLTLFANIEHFLSIQYVISSCFEPVFWKYKVFFVFELKSDKGCEAEVCAFREVHTHKVHPYNIQTTESLLILGNHINHQCQL